MFDKAQGGLGLGAPVQSDAVARLRVLGIVTALAVGLVVPGAGAQGSRAELIPVSSETVFLSPGHVVQTTETDVTANSVRQLRQLMDTDLDDEITASEVANQSAALERLFGATQLAPRVDGVRHHNITVTVRIEGAEGPTASSATIRVVAVQTTLHDVSEEDRHEVTLRKTEGSPGHLTNLTFRAPAGYQFTSVSGYQGLALSANKTVVQGRVDITTDMEGNVTLAMERVSTGWTGVPSPAMPVLAAALVACAALAARRRRQE